MTKTPAERQKDRRKRLKHDRVVEIHLSVPIAGRDEMKAMADERGLSFQDWAVDILMAETRRRHPCP